MNEQRIVPTLRITNDTVSRAFYLDGLGCMLEWEHRFEPHFPVFLSLTWDGLRFFLSQHTGDCQPGGLIHFYVPDVDAVYQDLVARQVPIASPPSNDLPGLRCMTVIDPDGNQLRFLTRL